MEKYTYSEYKAWRKVNQVMGIAQEVESDVVPKREPKSDVSAETKAYIAEKQNPIIGKSVF